MKRLSLIILLCLAGCSSIETTYDQFNNSTLIHLAKSSNDFNKIDGLLEIDTIIFSKDYRDGKISDINMFLKFKGNQVQFLEGDSIEIKIDDTIHKLKLLKPKPGVYEINGAVYKNIGAYTYTDTAKPNMNVIAMESVLTKEITDSILKVKLLTLRIYTKKINGVSKNTFEDWDSHVIVDLKKFINFTPEK